jgi:hypothetical protein
MSSTITYNPTLKIIETVYRIEHGPSELFEVAAATLSLARKHQCTRFFGDCTALLFGQSMADVRNLVTFIKATGVDGHDKEALLIPSAPDAVQSFVYFEELCQKDGFRVKVFQSREDAVAWLLED